MRIPRISIHCSPDENDDLDDVFDESTKENLTPFAKKILFPSFGTSPSKGVNIDSPLNMFSSNLLEDSRIKTLGKGSFGTVVLGCWRGKFLFFFKSYVA